MRKKIVILLALLLIIPFLLTLTGCGSSSNSGSDDIIIANGGEPQNPLIPINTTESNGAKIINLLYSGLTYIDENGKTQLDLAESINTTDNKTYDIKLRPNLKWSDGTALTAQDFVSSWNYTAKTSNAMLNNDFFKEVKGFKSLNSNEREDTLSGLELISDTEFKITFSHEESDFPELATTFAYFPVKASDLTTEGLKEIGEHPIASGAYMPASTDAWKHNASFEAVKNPNYGGTKTVNNAGVTFKFYTTDSAAYADLLADKLDVLDTIPNNSLKSYKNDLGDRAINQPATRQTMIATPSYLPHFKFDKEGILRRVAISQAIDRQSIINNVLNGAATTATDYIPPTMNEHSDNPQYEENIIYNPESAKAKWQAANKISQYDGPIKIIYNSDSSSNQVWVEAVANSISNTLGIKVEPEPIATFAQVRQMAVDKKLDGLIRNAWEPDYPSAWDMIGPYTMTGGGNNDAEYANPEYDAALTAILKASTDEEKKAAALKAEQYLLRDLPEIMLWDNNITGGYSKNVSNIKIDIKNTFLYNLIKKN